MIDSGAFGQVIQCIDHKDPKRKFVAAKISKNKKFDVDNANVEIKLLTKLHKLQPNEDIEGLDRIVKTIDTLKFRQHVIIVFEYLHLNLYTYMKENKRKKNIFSLDQLKIISYQMI